MNTFTSAIAFSEFKLNSDGLIPVVVQDYKTDEVLMVAYMNEEAFEKTIATGKMTYYSRSRQELWVKAKRIRRRYVHLEEHGPSEHQCFRRYHLQHG